ncbi:MAG: nitrite reductase, copper-containing [Deltaproteobacteria bacterium]|nr:nitrite reductase, copper-containing [Deltaproteobacteria bacterium]
MIPNRSTLPALLAQLVFFAATAAFHAEAAGVPAPVAYAPNVPPPLKGGAPQTLVVNIETKMTTITLAPGVSYEAWTFGDGVPGPFIRARVGDTLEMHLTNNDASGMMHNIDLHAVTGPGGGAAVTLAMQGEEKVATFRLMHAGLFVYHCATPPVPTHIANGMYGLILVEPRGGLRRVDREFYVMQSEFYTDPPSGGVAVYSPTDGAAEHPRYVVFNGAVGSLTGAGALTAATGERVRIYFGNAGPNLISSFHVIGEVFDKVYREGDLLSRPGRSIQTTLVPAGGAAMVEFDVEVPGTYVLVDHAIYRTGKGGVGHLVVTGPNRPDIYDPPGDGGH